MNISKEELKIFNPIDSKSQNIEQVSEIGTGIFDGDSVQHRENIIHEKEKALTLSKQIHTSLTELQSKKFLDKDSEWVEVYRQNPSDLLVKRMVKEHTLLLQRLSDSIKIYQEKAKKVPVEMKKKTNIDILNLEQVQLTQDEIQTSDKQFEQELNDLKADVEEIAQIFQTVNQEVLKQHEKVEIITDNIEEATIKVEDGTKDLKKATLMTGFGTTLLGGAIGGILGGPLGAIAGWQIGLGIGLATTGVSAGIGLLSGYLVSKKMNSVNGAHDPTSQQVKIDK